MTDYLPISYLQERGWCPAEPLLTADEARGYARIGLALQDRLSRAQDWRTSAAEPDFVQRPWFKSLHAISPEYFDLGTHPAIVSRVTQVLGDNVLLWGAALIERQPDQIHRWHVDVEHATWPGVSVFVALDGVHPGLSGLKFIRGSHRFRHGPRPASNDDEVLAEARQMDPVCKLDYPPVCDGEFMLFSGRVWHGSANSAGRIRCAALLQYTVPASKVAIPITWDPPIVWSQYAPPCALAAGRDEHGVNRLVVRPSAPTLRTAIT